MTTLTLQRAASVPARLRGIDVRVDVEVDVQEIDYRAEAGIDLHGLGSDELGALLAIPRWEHARRTTMSAPSLRMAAVRPDLVEQTAAGCVRRLVGPPVWVEMVSLSTGGWKGGLRAIGRFAPYSARRLVLSRTPADIDELMVEATYWGVGVRVVNEGAVEDLVEPAPFVPHRYTGASWAFAEQAFAATAGMSEWRVSR